MNLPPALIYVAIGAGAAVENIVPPVPADTFVLLGAFLAESGRADPVLVFVVTWVCNVASAVLVYRLAHRYGQGFFNTAAGHWLLRPKQLETISVFYERWGTPAIFVSRFLPAFRALVPVFAGVTHVPLGRVLPPLAVASAVWYGCLVYIGAAASRNWEQIMRFFAQFSTALLAVAAVLIVLVAAWWVRSRRDHA
ncbi:MAG TPA: DedA family protein [Longimicrobiales bacterium]|nr:DedA family protein [Longimicrobiales bacterium]